LLQTAATEMPPQAFHIEKKQLGNLSTGQK